MKRLLVLVLVVLTGCRTVSLDSLVQSAMASPLPNVTNHSKPMFRYYVPPTVGVISTSHNSTLFRVNGYDILMNLSIAQIVSSAYYEEQDETTRMDLSDFEVVFRTTGSYFDANSQSRNFTLDIIRLRKGMVSILMSNQLVDLVAIVSDTSMNLALESMITIMRSVEVDEKLVVATYSTKEIIDRDAIFSEFFEQVPPENGSLQDMYDRLNPGKTQEEGSNQE